jgi:hypothetical protein
LVPNEVRQEAAYGKEGEEIESGKEKEIGDVGENTTSRLRLHPFILHK